jgi:hypothetical protein
MQGKNHRRGPRDTLPFYKFTKTYTGVTQRGLWTGGALSFAPLSRAQKLLHED